MAVNREPVAIAAAVRSVLAVAIGFGLNIDPEQLAAIVVAVEVVLGLFVRASVTPNGTAMREQVRRRRQLRAKGR